MADAIIFTGSTGCTATTNYLITTCSTSEGNSGAISGGGSQRYAAKKDHTGADLRGLDLRKLPSVFLHNLVGCVWDESTKFPAPEEMLRCWWGPVSNHLTTELMRYDCRDVTRRTGKNARKLFAAWAKGGKCPYEAAGLDGMKDRAAHFWEHHHLWRAGKSISAKALWEALRKERMTYAGSK